MEHIDTQCIKVDNFRGHYPRCNHLMISSIDRGIGQARRTSILPRGQGGKAELFTPLFNCGIGCLKVH